MRWQAVVRFLWDAHNCEEAREEEELVVSTPYIEHWNELIDLWYLGMQVLDRVPICLEKVRWENEGVKTRFFNLESHFLGQKWPKT